MTTFLLWCSVISIGAATAVIVLMALWLAGIAVVATADVVGEWRATKRAGTKRAS